MNQTQSIIVYRNPGEQMLWEGGYMFPVFGSLAVWLIVFLVVAHFVEKVTPKPWRQHWISDKTAAIAGIIGFVAAFFTWQHLTRFL